MENIEHIATGTSAWHESAEESGHVDVITFTLPLDGAPPAPVPVADRPARMAGRWPRSYKRPDELILDDLVGALARSQDINAREVELSCADGVITASGTVATRAESLLLEALAASTVGLADYVSQVTVSKAPPKEPAPEEGTADQSKRKPTGAKGGR